MEATSARTVITVQGRGLAAQRNLAFQIQEAPPGKDVAVSLTEVRNSGVSPMNFARTLVESARKLGRPVGIVNQDTH